MSSHHGSRIALMFFLVTAVATQSAHPGFALDPRYQSTGVQSGITAMASSGNGRTLWVAHRHILYAVDAAGTPVLAHAFAPNEWIGAAVADRGDDSVWFTNFATDGLYVHEPRNGQTRQAAAAPHNTFDLAFVPGAGALLASANPLWPSPGARAGIWHIDIDAGQHREVVQLVGPSGPIVFDANGDLLYATQANTSPPPPGSTDILRFTRARLATALAGGAPLTLSDATYVARGFDGAFDLAIDGQARGYVTDGARGQVWRADLATGAREAMPFVATGNAGTTHLAWLPGPGPATFAAFQPQGGGSLLVAIEDWANQRSTAFVVAPARPTLDTWPSNPVPRGPARVSLTGAAPSAPCLLLVSPLPTVREWNAGRVFGAPLWLGLDLSAPPLTWPAVASAGGDATWAFIHTFPGGAALTLQAITLEATAGAGSSGVHLLDLAR